jgi:hypothetical protein
VEFPGRARGHGHSGHFLSRLLSPSLFAAIFTVTYAVLAIRDWTLFYYYPLTHEVSRTPLTIKSGPSMHWYAWILTAGVVAAVVSILVPRAWTKPMDRYLAWVPTLFAIVAILVFEKKWFV